MARGVRQSCPASGFLFTMAFDPIFRWLHDSIIPRDPAAPDFLQPAPCAYADDFAVAASSFRSLMPTLSPVFEVVDSIAGLSVMLLGTRRQRQFGFIGWVSTHREAFPAP